MQTKPPVYIKQFDLSQAKQIIVIKLSNDRRASMLKISSMSRIQKRHYFRLCDRIKLVDSASELLYTKTYQSNNPIAYHIIEYKSLPCYNVAYHGIE